MNSEVRAALDANNARIARVVTRPSGDLGYGRDLSCTTDLDPALAEVDPASPKAIAQALIRRYITPRGALIDDANYGLDIRGMLNRGATQRDLRALSGAMRGEAIKDDRVSDVAIDLVADNALSTRTVQARVTITPNDPALVPFAFTFAVTNGAVLEVTING